MPPLIEDLHERGLDQRVLLVVGGDFGRTPRISYAASSGGGVASGAAGVVQPGRDHWPHAMSFLFSGGGIAEGQVIGATDRRGEHPTERRVGAGDFLATLYRHLGIDANRATVQDPVAEPVPLLQQGGDPDPRADAVCVSRRQTQCYIGGWTVDPVPCGSVRSVEMAEMASESVLPVCARRPALQPLPGYIRSSKLPGLRVRSGEALPSPQDHSCEALSGPAEQGRSPAAAPERPAPPLVDPGRRVSASPLRIAAAQPVS